MKTIEYSQIVSQKLKLLQRDLTERFSSETARNIITKITHAVRNLELFEETGVKISALYNIECEYRCLYIAHNYLFYRIEHDKIIIIEMFHEREDFMQKLFRSSTSSQDPPDCWDI